MKVGYLVICSTIVLAGVGVFLAVHPVTAESKPREPVLHAMYSKQEAEKRKTEAAWSRVLSAVSSGDVKRVKFATKAYEASGFPMYDFSRAHLAEFYIAKGAIPEAREQLEVIVHRPQNRWRPT